MARVIAQRSLFKFSKMDCQLYHGAQSNIETQRFQLFTGALSRDYTTQHSM